MKFPQLTILRAMLLVALIALVFGLPIEIRRLRKLSEDYRVGAARVGARERGARKDAARSHEEWASIVEKIEGQERASGGWYKMGRPYSPEKAPPMIRFYEARRLKFERLSRYPWLPVTPDPPSPK